jgi:hypothetical protein
MIDNKVNNLLKKFHYQTNSNENLIYKIKKKKKKTIELQS